MESLKGKGRSKRKVQKNKAKSFDLLDIDKDYFQKLSLEIICRILKYLTLQDVIKLSSQCRKFQHAVSMYLRVLKVIDFTEGQLQGWMPSMVTDDHLNSLLPKCRELQYIHGFHPIHISKRRLRNCQRNLSIPGILAALNFATNLKGIEVSDINLVGAILNYFPNLKILGTFRNRTDLPLYDDKLSLTTNPKVTNLHLTGVCIPSLPNMDSVQYLYLNMVKITNPHPFREFSVPKLQTFVMSNCCGPVNALSYVSLFTGLAASKYLTRLEMVKVPFMGGLIQHIVEDSWRENGFRQLTKVTFSSCKNALEMDIGYLLITAANKLKELSIQPSLTKDSLFAALNMAEVSFSEVVTLSLGYVDVALESGDIGTNVTESPAMITDNGMKSVGQTFQYLTQLDLYNCPHLIQPCTWFSSVVVNWAFLQHLTLRRCHSIRLQDFSTFISHLPRLEMLQLEYMFREPPKGCSRVGLSAGTGLGVSSALVQNHAHNNDMPANPAPDDEHDMEDDEDINNNDEQEVNRADDNEEENMEIEPIIRLNNAGPIPAQNQVDQHPNPPEPAEVEVQPPLPPELPVHENPPLPKDEDEENVATAIESKKIASFPPNNQKEGEKKPDEDKAEDSHPSCSHDNSSNNTDTEIVHDINEPGCSHWKYGSEDLKKTSNSKTSDPTKIKKRGKSSDCERRAKTVRIVSVKCSPPAKSTRSGTRSGQELSADAENITGVSEGRSFEVQGDAVGPSEKVCYLYDKPPPKYSEVLGENRRSSLDANLPPPPEYSGENIASSASEPVKAESSNSGNMKGSPPDYKTAMSEGNVLDVPSCSCGYSASNPDSINKESPETEVNQATGASETERPATDEASTSTSQNMFKPNECGDKNLIPPEDTSSKPKRKRRSSSELLGMEVLYREQGCQAVSEEIREETKKAAEKQKLEKKKKTNSSNSTRKSARQSLQNGGTSSNSGGQQTPRSRRSSSSIFKRSKSVHHKATSTSDPVLEDDHIKVLLLRSDSLVCVKLHMVGITDLIIEDCPQLASINGSACRVLRKVTIYSAPKLSKTNFVQCKKLDQTHLVNEVCDQISEHNRLIFLRPMHEFDLRDFEGMLFQQPDICYYICIIYDYSPCPNQTLYNRMRVMNWLELFNRFNIDFVRCMDFVETSWYRMDATNYPWKRDIYRMQGLNENGSKWKMITDLPWIRMLSQCPDIKHPNQVVDDHKAGVYCQAAKGHFTKEDARDGITLELAEFQAANQTFFINSIVVYFNMCDTSGVPTPDFYL